MPTYDSHGYYTPDIKYDEELVEIGYSNMKIDYNILKPLDKTMGKVFGFPMETEFDYYTFKEYKNRNSTINPEKPGLATLFRQAILTIGDMFGFLFKLVKDGIDQFVNSFIMPILTPAVPYSLPIIIQKMIEIIQKIITMVNEAITIVTDTLKWLLEKVAGKLMEIKIPLPEFKIPMFGLELSIPSIDLLGLLSSEPFATLPSEKINNFNDQIKELNKNLNELPINDISGKISILEKIAEVKQEISNLS